MASIDKPIGRCAHCHQTRQLPGRCRHGRLCSTCQAALDTLTQAAHNEPGAGPAGTMDPTSPTP